MKKKNKRKPVRVTISDQVEINGRVYVPVSFMREADLFTKKERLTVEYMLLEDYIGSPQEAWDRRTAKISIWQKIRSTW